MKSEKSGNKRGAPIKSEKTIQRAIRFPPEIEDLIQKEIKKQEKENGYKSTLSKVVIGCVKKVLG